MVTMLFISILLVVLYVGATIWRKRELPESVSALVHDLSKPWKWVWSLWLALVTLFLSPALTHAVSAAMDSLLVGAMIVSLAMTAAMPLLPRYANRAHYACSIIAGIISQALVWVMAPYWLYLWGMLSVLLFLVISGVPKCLIKAKVLILEAVCCLTFYGALFTKIIMI